MILAPSRYRLMSIDRVPHEVWADIFTKHMHDRDEPGELYDPKHAPVLFTLVCRKWRDTALSTAKLWTNLWLPRPPRELKAFQLYVNAVKGWLKCSQTLPIHIQARNLEVISTSSSQSYISALLEHAYRWESVYIYFGEQDPSLSVFDGISETSFPLLRSFEIRDSCGPVSHSLTRALKAAPNLRIVSLGHAILDDSWILPWSNLTSLVLSIRAGSEKVEQRLDLEFFVFAMSACTRLRSLRLNFSFGYWVVGESDIVLASQSATVPSLESLVLEMDLTSITPLFAKALILPNLKALTFHAYDDLWGYDCWERFVEFVQHFSSTLEDLSLYKMPLVEEQLVELLTKFPRLARLRLSATKYLASWDMVFCYLGSQMCPNILLEELIIDRPRRSETYEWGYKALVAMVESRRTGQLGSGASECSQLLSLHLLSEDATRMEQGNPEEYAKLMRLIEQGLKLTTSFDS